MCSNFIIDVPNKSMNKAFCSDTWPLAVRLIIFMDVVDALQTFTLSLFFILCAVISWLGEKIYIRANYYAMCIVAW